MFSVNFHLNIYGWYKVLKDMEKNELSPSDEQCFTIPKPSNVTKSADMDVGCYAERNLH